jgi:hypothetical protein
MSQAAVITYGLFALAFLMAARLGRWYLLQTVVFCAVMCAGIYFKWTIGSQATAFVAMTATFIATVAVAVVVAAVAQVRSTYRNWRSLRSQRAAIVQERRVEDLRQQELG